MEIDLFIAVINAVVSLGIAGLACWCFRSCSIRICIRQRPGRRARLQRVNVPRRVEYWRDRNARKED